MLAFVERPTCNYLFILFTNALRTAIYILENLKSELKYIAVTTKINRKDGVEIGYKNIAGLSKLFDFHCTRNTRFDVDHKNFM